MQTPSRRHCFEAAVAVGAVGCLGRPAWANQITPAQHLVAQPVGQTLVDVPKGKRVPFGWPTATVSSRPGGELTLRWSEAATQLAPTHLRLAIGLDVRNQKLVDVHLADSGRVIGQFDIRYPSPLQIFETPIAEDDVDEVWRHGVTLRLKKGSDLQVILAGPGVPEELAVHLLMPGELSNQQEFERRMNSLACIQPFGWMEGCVLDGLLDLAELPGKQHLRQSAQRHLDQYLVDERLVYQGIQSDPRDGKIYGIEGTLPFAAIARLHPDHPVLQTVIDFWTARRRDRDGSIQDGNHLSSEGAYTVGYALAEVAMARNSEELMTWAIEQSLHRFNVLFDPPNFWRTHNDNGGRGNKNWARGTAWQLLGMVRTMRVARDHADITPLVKPLRRLSEFVIGLQREDGLWSVFADQPTVPPDTGGSAGLAAALAIGAGQGWLSDPAVAARPDPMNN